MEITFYIVCHDQRIVEAFERHRTFDCLPRYRYLFVGSRPCDRISHLPTLIVARGLPRNIEEHAALVSFTGWYAVSENGLCETEGAAFLDYDNIISAELGISCEGALDEQPEALWGLYRLPMNSEFFLREGLGGIPLVEALSKGRRLELQAVISDYVQTADDLSWPACSAFFCRRNVLAAYVDWCKALVPHLISFRDAGHAIERTLRLWTIIAGVPCRYLEGLSQHLQLDSHHTTFGYHASPEAVDALYAARFEELAAARIVIRR